MPQIWEDYGYFIDQVVKWLEPCIAGNRLSTARLACDVMRDEQNVWCGIGVYTVSELFFLAGMISFTISHCSY